MDIRNARTGKGVGSDLITNGNGIEDAHEGFEGFGEVTRRIENVLRSQGVSENSCQPESGRLNVGWVMCKGLRGPGLATMWL
jgi:hypothetical protein